MAFKLVHAKYDRESERAYVELRDEDDDGGDRDIGSHHLLVSHHGEAVEAADRAGYCAKSAPHSEARRSFYLSFGIAGTAFRPPPARTWCLRGRGSQRSAREPSGHHPIAARRRLPQSKTPKLEIPAEIR